MINLPRMAAIAALSLVAGSLFAATTVPNTFVNGTVADADEVNANFEALAKAIDNIPAGPKGPAGISCWDLNENGIKDPEEDMNKDGAVDVMDCRPAAVAEPPPGNRMWYLASSAMLYYEGLEEFGEHWLPIYRINETSPVDCSGIETSIECLSDPIPDPCGLFAWEQLDSTVAVSAMNAYNYKTITYQAGKTGPQPYSGARECRIACLNDAQCVGGVTVPPDGTDDATTCHFLAKSSIGKNWYHPFYALSWKLQAEAWFVINWQIQSALTNVIFSVCPAPVAP